MCGDIISVHRILKYNACFPICSYMFLIFDSIIGGKWHFDVFKICFSVIVCEWQALTLVKWTNSCSPGSIWYELQEKLEKYILFIFFHSQQTTCWWCTLTHKLTLFKVREALFQCVGFKDCPQYRINNGAKTSAKL